MACWRDEQSEVIVRQSGSRPGWCWQRDAIPAVCRVNARPSRISSGSADRRRRLTGSAGFRAAPAVVEDKIFANVTAGIVQTRKYRRKRTGHMKPDHDWQRLTRPDRLKRRGDAGRHRIEVPMIIEPCFLTTSCWMWPMPQNALACLRSIAWRQPTAA